MLVMSTTPPLLAVAVNGDSPPTLQIAATHISPSADEMSALTACGDALSPSVSPLTSPVSYGGTESPHSSRKLSPGRGATTWPRGTTTPPTGTTVRPQVVSMAGAGGSKQSWRSLAVLDGDAEEGGGGDVRLRGVQHEHGHQQRQQRPCGPLDRSPVQSPPRSGSGARDARRDRRWRSPPRGGEDDDDDDDDDDIEEEEEDEEEEEEATPSIAERRGERAACCQDLERLGQQYSEWSRRQAEEVRACVRACVHTRAVVWGQT
jgi:hypothetical protein